MKKDTTEIADIKDEPLLAITILKTGTTVGNVILAKGANIKLPKSQAEALASITPPVAEITGI
jgi:hypothetical protein